MAEEYTNTCTTLDKLLVEVLQLMQKEIACKLQLEEVLKSGYINMAKARYIMGNNSVSLLQVPSEDGCAEMAALNTIIRDSDDKYPTFILNTSCSNAVPNSSELHHRIKDIKIDSSDNMEEILMSSVKSDASTSNLKSDPIKWFGILVPPCLRQAQNDFKLSLELAVDCVNIQMELSKKKQNYDELLSRKKDIISLQTKSS